MQDAQISFSIERVAFDEAYQPADDTRITTNFANLARGESRQENLRNTLRMIDNRFNALVPWDNGEGQRYSLTIDIISAKLHIETPGQYDALPLIEILETTIHDRATVQTIAGSVGNNFSSYIRDYDFSILLRQYLQNHPQAQPPENFGVLHGQIFKRFLASDAYRAQFTKAPVICLSVSTSTSYRQTSNVHPILGVEYVTDASSRTDAYFAQMGMTVRYFMPPHSVAPLAFYHFGDLLDDYSHLELASATSVMESFQKIYRPEIYNANSRAAQHYQPSLNYQDHSLTRIVYDREERSRLAVAQGQFAQERIITPYQDLLSQWAAPSAAGTLLNSFKGYTL